MTKKLPDEDEASKPTRRTALHGDEQSTARGRALMGEAFPAQGLRDALMQYQHDGYRLEPEWRSLERHALIAILHAIQAIDDPSPSNAAMVAKMAGAGNENQGAATATARATIKHVVQWSATAVEGEPEETRLARRVALLRAELGKIDPRLQYLDEATATRLVELHGRKNGDGALAANWAWRAGYKTPGDKPQTGRVSRAFLDLYQNDPARKRAARKTRRTRQVGKRGGV